MFDDFFILKFSKINKLYRSGLRFSVYTGFARMAKPLPWQGESGRVRT